MSAVLQALKKIERQRAQTARMVGARQQIDPLRVTHGNPRKSVGKLAGAIVAAMLVVGAIGFLIRPPATAPGPEADHAPKASQTGDLPAGQPVVSPRPPATAIALPADTRSAVAASVATRPASPAPEPALTPESASPVPSRIPAAPVASALPAPPDVSVDLPASALPVSEAPAISLLTDANITLQAVVWSETPDACMVVINDRILRVGDHIDGYRLVEIGPNHVLLSRSGRAWRLPFMRR
jgi:hypothetical protein